MDKIPFGEEMEEVSIIIPVLNKIEATIKCIDTIKRFNRNSLYEIIIIDNGSIDETPAVLANKKDIVYVRKTENLGISKAYNEGAKLAKYNILCFMHNDVFVYEEDWISKMSDFICKTPDAGIIGLYGAKTMRKDGSFRGRTIVHSKKNALAMSGFYEKVAVVDGLLMMMHRNIFDKIGGFNNEFSIHFYDKDISMRALINKMSNYVVSIPFEHLCGTTRKSVTGENRTRDEAQKRFMEIWNDFLPADVTTWKDKIKYIFFKKK